MSSENHRLIVFHTNSYSATMKSKKHAAGFGGALGHRKMLATSDMLCNDASPEPMDYRNEMAMKTTSIAAVC
jgi:hypothetical protein